MNKALLIITLAMLTGCASTGCAGREEFPVDAEVFKLATNVCEPHEGLDHAQGWLQPADRGTPGYWFQGKCRDGLEFKDFFPVP